MWSYILCAVLGFMGGSYLSTPKQVIDVRREKLYRDVYSALIIAVVVYNGVRIANRLGDSIKKALKKE